MRGDAKAGTLHYNPPEVSMMYYNIWEMYLQMNNMCTLIRLLITLSQTIFVDKVLIISNNYYF